MSGRLVADARRRVLAGSLEFHTGALAWLAAESDSVRLNEIVESADDRLGALEAKITEIVEHRAPPLLRRSAAEALTAAEIIGEIAGIDRSRPTPSGPEAALASLSSVPQQQEQRP